MAFVKKWKFSLKLNEKLDGYKYSQNGILTWKYFDYKDATVLGQRKNDNNKRMITLPGACACYLDTKRQEIYDYNRLLILYIIFDQTECQAQYFLTNSELDNKVFLHR